MSYKYDNIINYSLSLVKEEKEVQFFVSENGKCYIKEWLKKLDIQTRARLNNNQLKLVG